MEPVDMVMWTDIGVCLPLTIIAIFRMCCVDRRDLVPPLYYTHLLVSNLIQFCAAVFWVAKLEDHRQTSTIADMFFFFGVITSLHFKTCIVLERYFFIAWPLLDFLRQTKGSVLVSVLIWVVCVITIPFAILLQQYKRILILGLFPVPVFVLCLAGTVRALPAVTSAPAEEKLRSVGAVLLLQINYFVLILPALCLSEFLRSTCLAMILLSSFVDLILFFFMQKGPIDRLLARLRCCSTDSTAESAADHQCDGF